MFSTSLNKLKSTVTSASKKISSGLPDLTKTPTMPPLSQIPSVIGSGLDKLAGKAVDSLTSTVEDFMNFDETQTPDYGRFMRVVENQDLARSNMFLVRFGDFRTTVDKDGVVNFSMDSANSGMFGFMDNMPGGVKYAWSKVQGIMNDNMKRYVTPKITKALGNSAPELIRMIPGAGELIDGLTGVDYDVNRDLALMVKAVNLPGTQLDTTLNKTDRLPFHEVKGRTMNSLTITFYCTPGFDERILMLAWMNQIHNNKKGTYGFYHSYAKDIDVLTLDRTGVMQSLVHCEGCFPIRVGDVSLDYETNSQLATVEVEFAVAHMSHNRVQGKQNPIDSVKSLLQRGKDIINAPKNIWKMVKKI